MYSLSYAKSRVKNRRFFNIRRVLLNNNNDFYKTNNRENVTKSSTKQVNNILENPNRCFSGFETVKNFVSNP